MTIVVTGAAGFVGSHLVDRCLRDGARVIGVDNFVTGDRRNLAEAESSGNFRFIELDLGGWDPFALRDALGDERDIALFFHFASPASPVDYVKLQLETLAVNSRGTQMVAEAAAASGARVLYASTSEVYGDPLEHPQRETYWGNVNPNGHRSCYDEAKRYGEALLAAYMRSRALDVRIVRIFNTYGPRMRIDDGRVVPNFIVQALSGEPMTVYGEGTQTRSFCYVDDLVDGIVRMGRADDLQGNLVLNVGNPIEMTVRELAETVAEIVGVPVRYVPAALPPDDPTRRRADITLARAVLGWSPQIDLREGLKRTVAYISDVLEKRPVSTPS